MNVAPSRGHILPTGRALPDGSPELCELELPLRIYHALRRAGYKYIKQVQHLSYGELLLIDRIGEFSVGEIFYALRRWQQESGNAGSSAGDCTVMPEPVAVDPKSLQSLVNAFYACYTDQERIAALLLQAAHLIDYEGAYRLRSLAMALLEAEDIQTASS
jgi:hypothetical protein